MLASFRAASWLLCLLLLSSVSLAQTPQPRSTPERQAATLAKAREAFRLGTALAKQSQWSEAMAAYERSQSLHRHAATTYNIGFCLRALGRYTLARVTFRRALVEDQRRPGELPASMKADAVAFGREIDGKIVRVTITVRGDEAAVAVDGRPLVEDDDGSLVAGVAPVGPPEVVPATFVLQLDPGAHTLVVEQNGQRDARTVRYDAGAVATLELGHEAAEPRSRRPSADYRPGAYVSFGVAGAATISAIVAGAIALTTRSSLDGVCDANKQCPEAEAAAIRRLQRSANISTTSIVVAGSGLVLGTVLFVISPHQSVELEGGVGRVQARWRF